GQVVLPLGDGHFGVDVNLALGEDMGGMRGHITAGLRVRFPRVHGTREAMLFRASFRGRQGPRAEVDQRLRVLRVQQEQRREYPAITVPEHVRDVAEGDRTGTRRPTYVGSRAREQVIELRM